MNENAGKTCPFCMTNFKEGDVIKVCPACGAPHHEACWEENNGCTTEGCVEQKQEVQNAAPVCANCGTELTEGQKFCPNCGSAAFVETKSLCSQCGTELQKGQQFCSKCGQKSDISINANAVSHETGSNSTGNKKPTLIIVIAAAIVIIAVILIIILGGKGKKNFNDMYEDLSKNSWCTIASDGSYLKIDSNPRNIDSDDLTWADYENYLLPANEAIERINKELGFSDALYAKMDSTTWSQGKQTESNNKYTVTWTYHPDMGLEVMYEFKK